jgi:very-short-patch-repair endonuclease
MGTPNDPDHIIESLASGQDGIVTRRELLAAALSAKQIATRVRARRLISLYPGVYAVGHTVLTREGRWRAAVRACGARAVLSHGDAAAHWGLMPVRGKVIHVTTPSRSGRDPDRSRVRLHRVGTLRAWETSLNHGIPTTTMARTLLDLSPVLRPRAMEDVIAQADRLHLFDLVSVRRCLSEHPRQHGAPALRALLDRLAGAQTADLRSPLEVALLQLCDDHGLPVPRANVPLEGFMVDFHWPGTSLVVETDGYTYHSMPAAFEADRARDQALTLAGYTVVRFTHHQLTRQKAETARRLRRLIERRGSPDVP